MLVALVIYRFPTSCHCGDAGAHHSPNPQTRRHGTFSILGFEDLMVGFGRESSKLLEALRVNVDDLQRQ